MMDFRGEIKLFEVRDRGTFVPVKCEAINIRLLLEEDYYLMRRSGWASTDMVVFMTILSDCRCRHNPVDWGDRTFLVAHGHIADHWQELSSGDVVDVQFILDETTEPKISERLEAV